VWFGRVQLRAHRRRFSFAHIISMASLSPSRCIALTDAQLADRKAEPYEYPCYKENGLYEHEPDCRQLCCITAFGGTPEGQGTPKWMAKVAASIPHTFDYSTRILSPEQRMMWTATPEEYPCFTEGERHDPSPGCDKRCCTQEEQVAEGPFQQPDFREQKRKVTPNSRGSSYASSSFSPSDEPELTSFHGRSQVRKIMGQNASKYTPKGVRSRRHRQDPG
jgi:hypothetical protein